MGYKLISSGSVVDAVMTLRFVKYVPRLQAFLLCGERDAQGIMSHDDDTCWHISGLPPFDVDGYTTVEVVETEDEEVEALIAALDANTEPIPIPEPATEIEVEELGDDAMKILKQHCIAKMAAERELAVADGFNVELSDGASHHFSLTQDDHLNMLSLDKMRSVFDGKIPYQADGEAAAVYTEEDFDAILLGASKCRATHFVYFKNLCAHIDSLADVKSLRAVFYGMKIPKAHKVLKEVK